MELVNGSITEEHNGYTEENFLFTYDENERQQQEIDSSNAKLVFSPKFIPLYPELLEQGLTLTEALLFGFIDFYKSNSSNNFYFTNEQISQIIKCNPDTVSRAITNLEKKHYIKTSRRMRGGGGLIRFVTDISYNTKLTNYQLGNLQNLQTNKNKINKNKINNNRENTHSIKKETFNTRESINEVVLKEIADKYQTPVEFVEDCWDSAINWLDSKGVAKKDYRAFLSNWVKTERVNLVSKQSNRRGGTVDVRV